MVPREHKIACGTEEVGGSSGTGNGIKCHSVPVPDRSKIRVPVRYRESYGT